MLAGEDSRGPVWHRGEQCAAGELEYNRVNIKNNGDSVYSIVRVFNTDNGWSNLAGSDDDVTYLTARDSEDCDSRIGYTWFVEQVDVKGAENWRERTQRGCPAWAVSLFWHVRGRIAPLHVPRFWQNAAFRRHGICTHSSVHVFGPEDDVWMTYPRYVELPLA